MPHRRIPYYLRWIRKAYEIAGPSPQEPLSSETETQTIRHLQQDCEKRQVNQARRALSFIDIFLPQQTTWTQKVNRKTALTTHSGAALWKKPEAP
jgi:hypothetical protein